MFYRISISALVLGLFTLKAFGFVQDARRIAQETFPSVVMLEVQDVNGRVISKGSGFFIREDVVVTNYPVIKGGSTGYVKLVGQDVRFPITGLVGKDVQRDLALIKVNGAKGKVLKLADISQIQTGETIFALGNPQGFEGSISPGIISGIRLRQIEAEDLIQITAPVSPGSSGGPVVNVRGEVVGVVSSTLKSGQNLNFAIPAPYVALLVASMRAVTPLESNVVTESSNVKDSISASLQERRSKLTSLLVEARELEREAIQSAEKAKSLYMEGRISLTTVTRIIKHRRDCTQTVNDIVAQITKTDVSIAEIKGNSYDQTYNKSRNTEQTYTDNPRHTNTQYGFSFQPPTGWKAEPTSGSYIASYTDPKRAGASKSIFLLMAIDSAIHLSDELLADTMLDSFAGKFPGLRITNRLKTTVAGFDSLKVDMTGTYKASPFLVRTVILRVSEQKRLYVFIWGDFITYFHGGEAAIENSIASFRTLK